MVEGAQFPHCNSVLAVFMSSKISPATNSIDAYKGEPRSRRGLYVFQRPTLETLGPYIELVFNIALADVFVCVCVIVQVPPYVTSLKMKTGYDEF